MNQAGHITILLQKIREGDAGAESDLAAVIYPELRRRARQLLAGERPEHTLQPTALVNEAYIRIMGNSGLDWQNRSHFFAVATVLMRQILCDHAKRFKAAKRGGGAPRAEFDDQAIFDRPLSNCHLSDLILDVDKAVHELGRVDPRQSRIVELRFFGGLTEEEIAGVLSTSARTVKREWKMAKAWLNEYLGSAQSRSHA